MGRIKDLNSALPSENDALVFDGSNGTKKISYAEFKQKLIDDGFGSGSSEAVVLTQAEYNSLPDEVKDSDTIFFISDAPFDLPNVVTCTSAEYAAMSDATKTDGRLYYVTDEEEVAKSLVVQQNVNSPETVPSSAVLYGLATPQSIGIAYDATNLSNIGGRTAAFRFGRLVVFNINSKTKVALSAGAVLFTGLPKPAKNKYNAYTAAGSITLASGTSIRVYVNESGNLVTEDAISDTSVTFNGSMTYVADS